MEYILELDNILFTFINTSLSNSIFDTILIPFRHKLFWIPLYLFLITFFIYNFRLKAIQILLSIAVLMTISDGMSSQLIKKNVKRIRPCHQVELAPIQRIPCSHGYSFTSSHATNHFALGTFLFLLFSFTKWRALFIVWASIISFAQVYVGVHFPFDIICGGILGMIIGSLVYLCLSKLGTVHSFA